MAASSNAVKGLVGVYFVTSVLSQKGYAVAVTSGNTPGVDLLVANPKNGKSITIQVKTARNARRGKDGLKWPCRKKAAPPAVSDTSFLWAFVDLLGAVKPGEKMPKVYFVPPSKYDTLNESDYPDTFFSPSEKGVSPYLYKFEVIETAIGAIPGV